jgi:hypothetical protein
MWLWQLPAILLTFLAWLQAPPMNLADVAAREALRRQATPKSVRSLTNDDVNGLPRRPAPTVPVGDVTDTTQKPAAGAAPGAAKLPGDTRDEAWWRTSVTDARRALERDQLLADALQSSVNALTTEWSARDDPAQRQLLMERRTQAVGELERMKEQITFDRKVIADLEEAARRDNVPAGWLR